MSSQRSWRSATNIQKSQTAYGPGNTQVTDLIFKQHNRRSTSHTTKSKVKSERNSNLYIPRRLKPHDKLHSRGFAHLRLQQTYCSISVRHIVQTSNGDLQQVRYTSLYWGRSSSERLDTSFWGPRVERKKRQLRKFSQSIAVARTPCVLVKSENWFKLSERCLLLEYLFHILWAAWGEWTVT